jgi:preprotein translocase subunit YajC
LFGQKGIARPVENMSAMREGGGKKVTALGLNQQELSILYIIVLFAILYFLMIRPQQTRQKKHQEMLRRLAVNDEVITIGGIYGTVVKVKEKSVLLRVADNVRIEFSKSAISQIMGNRESGDKE